MATSNAVKFSGVVKSLNVVEEFGESRIMVKTDQSFDSFDKEGTPTQNDTFGISHKKILAAACDNKVFKLIARMSVGRPIAPEVLGLLITDAEIEFTRELKKAGDTIDNVILDSDTYVTTIEKLTLHCKEFEPVILDMRNDWFVTPQKKVVANPFA